MYADFALFAADPKGLKPFMLIYVDLSKEEIMEEVRAMRYGKA